MIELRNKNKRNPEVTPHIRKIHSGSDNCWIAVLDRHEEGAIPYAVGNSPFNAYQSLASAVLKEAQEFTSQIA